MRVYYFIAVIEPSGRVYSLQVSIPSYGGALGDISRLLKYEGWGTVMLW